MIKPLLFIGLFMLLLTSGTTQAGSEQITLKMPPASLAQWYKPENKRQVWLHTMFRLRREMQAVKEYARQKDAIGTKKWGQRLAKSYRSIPEMVPEWKGEVRLDWADTLEIAAQQGNFKKVLRAHDKLNASCNLCHQDFQTLAAALYRSPDFSGHKIAFKGRAVHYDRFMELLSNTLNRIKIAIEDQRPQIAKHALKQLKIQLQALGGNCSKCHQDEIPKERILGEATQKLLKGLEESIRNKQPKQAGRFLGKAAVAICARCHGVHRTLSDLKGVLVPVQ
ncbi:MAG: hypothetical protein L3J26_12725 [Candidatus Polarisedimenticolaceae bacterium]|nr:hypothetical protein [Candidatus Polarisedimenticolaceae bacterium]